MTIQRRCLIASVTAFSLVAGFAQADLTWTGAVDNDVFNEANWDQDGQGPPPAGTVDPSNGTAGGPEVPILQDAFMTGAAAHQTGGNFIQFQMSDTFTLTLSGTVWTKASSEGWAGFNDAADVPSYFDVTAGSDVTLQFVSVGAQVNIDATSIVTFTGGGDPINSQTEPTRINMVPGARLALPTEAEFTEQGSEIFVDGIAFADDPRVLDIVGTTATAVAPPAEAPRFVDQPGSSVSVVLGGQVTLSVTAEGTAPIFYQWQLGGVDIEGAAGTTLLITNAGESVSGPYAVTASNVVGTTTSSNTFLTYVGPDLDPAEQVVFQLNPIEIAPILPDGEGRTYQWRKNGANLDGQTHMTLVTPPATLADDGSIYDLVYSLGGNTVTSAPATVIVPPAPTDAYTDLVLSDSPRAYYRLGEPAGAGVAAEEIALIASGGLAGDYGTNTVTGEEGVLLGDPSTAMRCLGDSNSFVTVDGDQDAVDTLGVSAPFTVEVWALAEGGQGTFRAPFAFVDFVNVLDISGWTFFANNLNRWEFRTGEGFVNSPDVTAWNAIEGPSVELGQWAHLVGVHDGTDMVFYVNGARVGTIPGAAYAPVFFTEVPCTIGAGSALDGGLGTTGDYWIGKVDEPALYGRALSAAEILDHYAAAFPLDSVPVIDTQPQDTTVLVGVGASFFVGANSVTPPSFQWLLDGGVLPDETNSVLQIAAAQGSDAGGYSVVVASSGGSVTSEVATLSVIEDVSGSSLSVSFLGYTFAGEAISDNGGSAGIEMSSAWSEIGPNVSNTTQPIGDLTDDQGAETGVTFSWTAKTNRRGNWDPLVNGDHAMLTGFIESRDSAGDTNGVPAALVVSNIPPLYTAGGYDVIVYMGAPAGAQHDRYDASPSNFVASISDGNETFYYHGIDGRAWDGTTWSQATTTDPGVVPPDANYAEFTGLTASTLTLTADAHPVLLSGPGTISAVQILPGRTAPAIPMSIGLVGGGVVVDWTGGGTLQSATDLSAGNWGDVNGGTVTSSPYQVISPLPAESFRLRTP